MRGPQVRFCERPGGAIPRAYSTVGCRAEGVAPPVMPQRKASPGCRGFSRVSVRLALGKRPVNVILSEAKDLAP